MTQKNTCELTLDIDVYRICNKIKDKYTNVDTLKKMRKRRLEVHGYDIKRMILTKIWYGFMKKVRL